MTKLFARDGVRFRYPTNWVLEVAADEEALGWDASVESPGTALAAVALRPGAVPADLVAEALAALAEEYPGLESTPAADQLAGRPAVGADFDFIALDTAVTGWVRAVDGGAGAVLVICQVGDFDREANLPVLNAICSSLALP